jgi:lysozyme family protein
MADYKNLISDILYAEGGLSKDKNDINPAKNPVPDGTGNHTNKGITWLTFKTLGTQLGYNPTPVLFYQMPQNIWLKIYKIGFWDYIKAGSLNSQAVANIYLQMAWGSGRDTAINQMFNWLNQYQKGIIKSKTKDNIIKAINDLTKSPQNEKELFLFLWNTRMAYLKSLTNLWAKYKNGWTKRMDKIKSSGLELIEVQSEDIKKKLLLPVILLTAIVLLTLKK